jgi:hypothetical protein
MLILLSLHSHPKIHFALINQSIENWKGVAYFSTAYACAFSCYSRHPYYMDLKNLILQKRQTLAILLLWVKMLTLNPHDKKSQKFAHARIQRILCCSLYFTSTCTQSLTTKSQQVMKPWQAPLNKAHSKRGKEEQRERTQVQGTRAHLNGVTKGQRNKLCARAPTSSKKHIRK